MFLYDKYKETLDNATHAIHARTFYAAYPEHPKAYAEDAMAKGQEWFKNQLNNNFDELLQQEPDSWHGVESSPYLTDMLGIKYPAFSVEKLLSRSKAAGKDWLHSTPETRAAVLVDSLEKIKTRFFDIAFATMHTTGQSFMMSFQASGPHANDRAMEVIALGYKALKEFPTHAEWEKPMGKMSVKVKKTWKAIGKGTGLVIGCSTFPVWNTVPGLYATLITGNAVIVKPHPGAILPIAIVVAELQKVLIENNFNPDLVQLATDTNDAPIGLKLAEHKDIKIIDYTGNSHFGTELERLEGKAVFTEKAGVNSVIIDSVNDIDAVMQNLAFAISLYSGQMCTAPQNFFIPESGIKAGNETLSYEAVVQKLVENVINIANNPKMGPGTLGAIQNIHTCQRLEDTKAHLHGKIILESKPVANEEFPKARTASAMIAEVDATDSKTYSSELFGPIVLIIKTKDTPHSVALAKELATTKGAISCGAYSTDETVKKYILSEMEEAFTPVSLNYTGPIWMNQNAAFSDFHVTGGNPAGNATFTDAAYLVRRFVWVGHKEVA